jgi:spore coat protein U-like protein
MKCRPHAAIAKALAAAVLALAAFDAAAIICSATTTPVVFGAYDVFATGNDDSTGTVVVTCSKQPGDPTGGITVGYEVEMGPGGSGNVTQRRMSTGAFTLNYNLYRNTARSQLWGNGVDAPSVSASFTLNNANPSRSRTHNVFGRIPPLQDANVGSYQDNVLVTIQY